MSKAGFKIDAQRAKGIGRMLFQKYDISKRGALQPKQCYEVFSDFCYRILNISNAPNMQQAESMHEILDTNHDKRVTEADFQNLALRYLCGQASTNRYETKTTTTVTISRESTKTEPQRKLTSIAKRRLDVVRRLFKKFDKDNSGYLTEQQIPFMLEETYKEVGQTYKPTKEDVKSYMRMVDKNSDGKVSIDEFEEIVLLSLQKAGLQIYEKY